MFCARGVVSIQSDVFSHWLAADGFTLSHRDIAVRSFWIVRWDSDYVIVLDDVLRPIARKVVRSGKLVDQIHVGLDVIGMRNLLKALLIALLEPVATLLGLLLLDRRGAGWDDVAI